MGAPDRAELDEYAIWLMQEGFWVSAVATLRGVPRLALGGAPHDVVVLSLRFGRGVLQAIPPIADPAVPRTVVALIHTDDDELRAACTRAGASHVLPASCTRARFLEVVVNEARTNRAARSTLSRTRAAGGLVSVSSGARQDPRIPLSTITEQAGCSWRETEVVMLVSAGLRYRDIARHLRLSPRTVESHASSAYRKLGLTRLEILERFAGLTQRVGGAKLG